MKELAGRLANRSLAEARADLMPRVRERFSYALTALEHERQVASDPEAAAIVKENPVVYEAPNRPLADLYAVGLCHDLPTMVSDVEAAELQRWATGYEGVLEVALENLRRKTRGASFERQRAGVYASTWQDSYDATRILLPELFTGLSLRGAPLAFLLQPHQLLVTGTEDERGIEACVAAASEALAQPRFMGIAPLRLSKEGWVPWTPDHDEPFGAELWKIRMTRLAGAYDAQKRTLDALHALTERRVFVASFTPATGEGLAFAYATWFDAGEQTLLPETDELLLGRGTREDMHVARVSFEKARAVLEPVPGLYPRRWFGARFPNEDELQAMGAVFVSKGKAPPPPPAPAGAARAMKAKDAAKALADHAAVAIDLRDAPAHGRSRLPGARSVPLASLELEARRAEIVALGKPVVLYDRSGGPALVAAAKQVAAWGVDACWLDGGILSWEAGGLTIER